MFTLNSIINIVGCGNFIVSAVASDGTVTMTQDDSLECKWGRGSDFVSLWACGESLGQRFPMSMVQKVGVSP